eukprot:TRINITY_DN6516_c0_g1_i1.p1 TRINITY_DN6516_c0_g1~~TRINITY_DN6516_c0_g1_i1.p1  ORF type:complete len:425 (+),score=73.03 TRINITY_DN6516_c0_g1_i1:175-1449(+)
MFPSLAKHPPMSMSTEGKRNGKRNGFMKTLSRTFSRTSSNPGTMLPNGPSSATLGAKANLSRRASTGHFHLPEGTLSTHAAVSRPAFGRIDTYQKLDQLGEGTYATVFRGISRVNGKIVALKEIRLEHEEGAPCTAIREVSLLKGLKHANIVTLHDIIHTRNSLTMVFEFVSKDLKAYMDACKCYMDLRNVKLFLYQLLRGLQYCHKKKVLHRDLKPQNLLINERGELKLADFGLARAKSVPSKTYSNEVVTLWYRPPDVLLGSTKYTGDIDMWGVGCIFGEMISGRPLFPGTDNPDQIKLIFRTLGSPSPDAWAELSALPHAEELAPRKTYAPEPMNSLLPRLDKLGTQLLQQLLSIHPKTRMTAEDAMRAPYFKALGSLVQELPHQESIFTASQLPYHEEPQLRQAERRKFEKQQRRTSLAF